MSGEVLVERVEALLAEAEGRADEVAVRLAQAMLELYGEGLDRFVGIVAAQDDDGALARAVVEDELVSHLLLLHGLHPVPVHERVLGALEEVRPYIESHGGSVELVEVEDGVATLKLAGSCDGCPSSASTLKHAIEGAVLKAAPDLERIEAEGGAPAPPAGSLLQIEVKPGWTATDGFEIGGDGPFLKTVAGAKLLFVGVDGTRYAYKPTCPGCGASLASATLRGVQLGCTGCDERFDVRAAGRGLTSPDLHLEPVPLLVDADGHVSVAVGAAA